MICYRRACLSIALLCFCAAIASIAWAQNPPAAPQQPPPTPEKKPQNPFETVPESQTKPAQPAPQQPALEAPKPAEQPKAQPGGQVIEDIQFRGGRRVPLETMRATITTKKGDIYNEEDVHRDFMLLWNSGRFDDIHLETEQGPGGGIILRYIVTERRVVRSIKYGPGLKSLTVSEVLDRFKERKVGLSVESQYDPNKVQHAAVVIKEYLAERGRQFATVDAEVRQIPPSSLEVFFNVNEGPKIKVGKITIVGNKAFSEPDVIRAMKNTHDYGIPHSILFENIFAKNYDS
jgi:outer membrane protein insertion porin family